jgi:hypothetical protein
MTGSKEFSVKMFFVGLLSLISLNAHGWGDRGHEIVGHIAQDELTPSARRALEKLLGRDFKLANEATWPDHVRSNRTYDRFKPWHYADHPDTTLPDVLGKNFPNPEDLKPEEKAALPFVEGLLKDQPYLLVNHAPKGDALQALMMLENMFTSPRATKEQKTFAIRYIAHILGDIHMPLHIGSGKDAGANSCLVRWKGESDISYPSDNGPVKVPINLHIVWDNLIPDERKCGSTSCGSREYASLLEREYIKEVALNKSKWLRGSHLDWAKESSDIREKIYPVVKDADGNPVQIEGKLAGRPYCKKGNEEIPIDQRPGLDANYYSNWRETAELRLLQAGHRLASRLNRLTR